MLDVTGRHSSQTRYREEFLAKSKANVPAVPVRQVLDGRTEGGFAGFGTRRFTIVFL